MDTKLIMEFYGMACAVLLPVILVLIIIFSKRGGVIDKLNSCIDRWFPQRNPVNNPRIDIKTTDKNLSDSEASFAKEIETDWEKNNKVMTCLKLKVGDSYKCVLNELERDVVGSYRNWTVSEPFVGEINEDTAVFTAKRVGKTYIVCGDARIYYIEIEPRQKNWFLETIYDAFAEGLSLGKFRGLYKKFKDIPSERLIISRNIPHTKVVTIQYDKDDTISRCIIQVENTESKREILQKGLAERMEQIKDTIQGVGFWVHKYGKQSEAIVDFAAFVIEQKEYLIIGLGLNWKQKGSQEEILANPGMFLYTFCEILNNELLPGQIICINEQENNPKSIQPNETTMKETAETTPITEQNPFPEQSENQSVISKSDIQDIDSEEDDDIDYSQEAVDEDIESYLEQQEPEY